jgi:hypothetical protein
MVKLVIRTDVIKEPVSDLYKSTARAFEVIINTPFI